MTCIVYLPRLSNMSLVAELSEVKKEIVELAKEYADLAEQAVDEEKTKDTF